MTTDTTTAPRRPLAGRIGRILFLVLAMILVIATAAAFFLAWTIQRSFPQTSGELSAPGLDKSVTVQRDARGVPTVTASSTDDLFFAQGYIHAQDRFFEMDFRRHVTSGRVAEMFGESQVATDVFLRTLGWRDVAEQEVEALDDTDRGYYEAYADGVNAYLASRSGADLSLEYAILGVQNPDYEPEPWAPADSVAWLKAMAWDLRTNIDDETDRARLAAALGDAGETDADAQALIERVYPGYPFDKHPVIVPRISEVDPLPEDEAADAEESDDTAAPAAYTGGTSDADRAASAAADALTTVRWEQADSVIEAASMLLAPLGEGIGSNSWVVSGDLTESGRPLLANDPHLGAALPSVWHQMQLRCAPVSDACPFDVAGFSFSGLPGIVIGHNADIAWGFTNLTTDVADLYIEKVQGDRYWRDGELQPLEQEQDVIRVAGGEDVPITIRRTVHGPIISGLTDDFTAVATEPVVGLGQGADQSILPLADAPEVPDGEIAVSLRWTALDPGTTAGAIFALDTARDFTQFRRAASLFDVPAQNLIYADAEGNIGYQAPGRLPIRGAGDGWLPQPGWDSAYDWTGFIPFEDLPVSYNPSEGFIVTANNAIVDDEYGHFLSRDWDYGYRAARITHLIERRAAAGPLTVQDMQAIQLDEEMWIGKQLAAVMVDVPVERKGPKAAVDLLRTWDAQNDADSPAAAFANVLWSNLVRNIFTEREVPLPTGDQGRLFTVVGAMLGDPSHPLWTNDRLAADGRTGMLALSANEAYDELASLQGQDVTRWNWGELHALTLTSETFGSSGIAPIEMLFNRGPYPVGGGSSVVNATGWRLGRSYATTTVPSMRMVVDLSDFDASTWIHLTGASGHAFHEHYTDQTEDWATGVQQPWPFTPDAVADATVDTLVLTPGS
ncbi:penicillin acylase family protein [Microbacterium soli]|uniref:Penicillin acylase family protein n=1 Tax=Microbacterium soli TaxID=446075 RepID=A0ABP7N182_9MICO